MKDKMVSMLRGKDYNSLLPGFQTMTTHTDRILELFAIDLKLLFPFQFVTITKFYMLFLVMAFGFIQ